MNDYIYMYGQILCTRSYVLKGGFPEVDSCGIYDEAHFHVGGETGTAAAILASLGCNVKLAGTHIGEENAKLIRDYFTEHNVDISELVYNKNFGGVVDLVLISGMNRTCFGEWDKLYARKDAWYEPIQEESVKNCICVGFDPYLDGNDTRVIEYCEKYGKKYATIDCRHDSQYNQSCEINAVSHEFLIGNYGKDADFYELHRQYTEASDGLIIFTLGEKGVMYGRKGQKIKTFPAYQVEVKSTLGAGDSFKAGTIYGLSKGMSDDDVVRYACAVAGVAIQKYPISEYPPEISEVEELIHRE